MAHRDWPGSRTGAKCFLPAAIICSGVTSQTRFKRILEHQEKKTKRRQRDIQTRMSFQFEITISSKVKKKIGETNLSKDSGTLRNEVTTDKALRYRTVFAELIKSKINPLLAVCRRSASSSTSPSSSFFCSSQRTYPSVLTTKFNAFYASQF